ncbi:MAG TPA: four-helix bundle copper-binding protein, partial [Chitinophaga sp.]|nr:four-helix bundle copper-binding protein [Chitinophaga sp.]
MTNQQYQRCLEACQACAVACHQCATACLNEEDIAMLKACIELDLECAVICNATATVLSMEGYASEQLCRV